MTRQDADVPEHDEAWLQTRWRSNLRRRLLNWFDQNARELPWRSDPTPYHVWVSEIMLQQTQVATVLPFYRRWMESFPSVDALANADEQDLMRHWEGLGYYRRVRSMHAAAKRIMESHGGEFPLNYDAVLALPGIGRYTAGAILSISSDARLPILEGNTMRVFSRLIALRQPPTESSSNRLLWDFAEKILPRHGSGQLNQAAMELGALVCQPRTPSCDQCPLNRLCSSRRLGLEQEIPGKIKKIRYEDRDEFAFIICHEARPSGPSRGANKYLARPLPDGARWSGLWDFPRCTEAATESAVAAADWLASQLGSEIDVGVRLKTMRHAVTKYRIRLQVHQASIVGGGPSASAMRDGAWQWVTLDELRELPLSVTGRKIADFLATQSQSILPLS